jgi:chromosomal replication initiator protein
MIHPYTYVGMKYDIKPRNITQQQVIDCVCHTLMIRKERIFLKSLRRDIVEARQMIYIVTRKCIKNASLKDIGSIFRQDHTTVLHGLRNIQNRLDTEPELSCILENILHALCKRQYTS